MARPAIGLLKETIDQEERVIMGHSAATHDNLPGPTQ